MGHWLMLKVLMVGEQSWQGKSLKLVSSHDKMLQGLIRSVRLSELMLRQNRDTKNLT